MIENHPIVKTNDIREARKQVIKRVMKYPEHEWADFKCYITTDMDAKHKLEEIAYTNKVWLNPNASPDWASKKKGDSTWREIVVEGSWFGSIVAQSTAALSLPSRKPKKKIIKKY